MRSEGRPVGSDWSSDVCSSDLDITYQSRLVFTPDGSLAFIQTCATDNNGSIRSYSRSPNGTLTPGPVYALPAGTCDLALTVSPDGRYLADSEQSSAPPYRSEERRVGKECRSRWSP